MRRLVFLFGAFLLISLESHAYRNIPEEGLRKEYYSNNGQYAVDVIEKTLIDSPCQAVFKVKGKVAWEKELPSTPGSLFVTNDGKYFVTANFGWADEGGYKSVSIYDAECNLKKDFPFESLRWLDQTKISFNGRYFVVIDEYG